MLSGKLNLNEETISEVFASMTRLLFDQLPIPINFIDANGKVIIMNKAFLDYLGIKELKDAQGKHIADIDYTTRLPIILKTGRAELGQMHKFQSGKEAIVHRIPIFYGEKVIGGTGIILIDDLSYFYKQAMEATTIKNLETLNMNKSKDVYKAKYEFDDILTISEIRKECKRKGRNYSKTDFTVLITGESGVGKELFAHSIHKDSNRCNGPFVSVNCAAIPDSLLESELFGYVEGAFTGAKKTGQQGKFELANGGTIFLDEIGELPLSLQAKLLRVLQEKEVRRIGDNKLIPLDVRVIAATNSRLEQNIAQGKFRGDLYYRLNVLNLHLPPLRETKQDIPLLISHFITLMYQNFDIYKKFPEDVIEILEAYDWPGNVRELKNIVERIAVNTEDNIVTTEDIPNYIVEKVNKCKFYDNKNNTNKGSLKSTLNEVEKDIILDTLDKCLGNKALTASTLGIPRMTLYRKLRSYGIN